MRASGSAVGLFWVEGAPGPDGGIYFRYGSGETSTFASMGCSSSSIHTCSKSVGGPFHVGSTYGNHCGLDTYGAYTAATCGYYMITCYGDSLYPGTAQSMGMRIFVRSGSV